jgi:hypothetical protein
MTTTQIKCDGCASIISDYDEDPDLFTDSEGQVFCEKCQAAHMADGWLLAQEFGAEMRYRDAVVEYLRPVNAMIDAADLHRKQLKGE